jgi:diguanylate cyclase (GGDEF)-like protein/PAS domain S-box-containing protein
LTTDLARTSLPLAITETLPDAGPAPDLGIDAAVYQGILERIEDGVYFVDSNQRVLIWNRGAEMITGFARQDVVGTKCGESLLCHVDSSGRRLCATGCTLKRVETTGVPVEADTFLQHKLGYRVPVHIDTVPLRNHQNKIVGAAQIFHSTAQDRRQDKLIEELSHLAMIDDLTRLPNRRHFDIQLDRRLAELGRFGWPFGVLMIDIDHFKKINDTHGHPMGDEILRLVGRTLTANCRMVDTVARWGGEEFAVIVANVSEEDLRRIAEKLRAMVEASGLRTTASAQLRATVSIGGALAVPNETAGELMRRTDEMLYAAKKSGRNCVRI